MGPTEQTDSGACGASSSAIPTKLIITGDMRFAAEAFALLQAEAAEFAKYTKIGWGWQFGPWLGDGSRFFVRRIKDGLSCAIRTSINDPKPLAEIAPWLDPVRSEATITDPNAVPRSDSEAKGW